MKETIDSKYVHNRKLIFEVRYEPNPKIVDVRGVLAEEIVASKTIPNGLWLLNEGQVVISDNIENNQFIKRCHIDTNRLAFISNSNHTNESFYSSFEKVFGVLTKHSQIDIKRIGFRVMGTYQCKTDDYEKVLEAFTKLFPQNFLIDEFNPKDFNFQLVYANGQYSIGPISKNDSWTKEQFPNDKIRVDKVGFAIDTDNYVLKEENSNGLQKNQMKDVFIASLSVEKLLFEKLKDY